MLTDLKTMFECNSAVYLKKRMDIERTEFIEMKALISNNNLNITLTILLVCCYFF